MESGMMDAEWQPGNEAAYGIVLALVRRPEFDVASLKLDAHQRPNCEKHELLLAARYRRLLFSTFAFATRALGAHVAMQDAAAQPQPQPQQTPPHSPVSRKQPLPHIASPPLEGAPRRLRRQPSDLAAASDEALPGSSAQRPVPSDESSEPPSSPLPSPVVAPPAAASPQSLPLPPAVLSFLIKVLATLYFRLPRLSQLSVAHLF